MLKKDDKTDKNNYRPITVFQTLSKIHEQFMQSQIYPYLVQTFSKYHGGFRKDLMLKLA